MRRYLVAITARRRRILPFARLCRKRATFAARFSGNLSSIQLKTFQAAKGEKALVRQCG